MKTKVLFLSAIAMLSISACSISTNTSQSDSSRTSSVEQSSSSSEASSSKEESSETSTTSSESKESSIEPSSSSEQSSSSIEESTTSSEDIPSSSEDIPSSSETISFDEESEQSSEMSSESTLESLEESSSSEEISSSSEIVSSSEETSSDSSSEEDKEASIDFNCTNQDYLDFFNHGNKVEVTVNITNDAIYHLAQYGVSYYDREEMYHPCDVVIKINDEVRFDEEEVGLRMKGNTSKNPGFVDENGYLHAFSHFKMSFKETFQEELDNDYYHHEWTDSSALKKRKKRRFGGMKKLDFKWNRNEDATFTKEAYSKYIYRDAGVLAQNINLVKFTLNTENDSYTEIYQAIEVVDGNTMERYYGEEGGQGNLYKGLYARANLTTDSISGNNLDPESSTNTNPTYPLKTNDDGPTYDHTLMKNLITQTNKKNVSAEQMETTLKDIAEVDNIIRYCAVAWVVGNPDDLRNNANNTYFYFNSINDRLSIIPYDDDRCFGIMKDWPVDMSQLPADSSRMQGMSYNSGGKVWLNVPLLWRIVCEDSNQGQYPLVKAFNDLYRAYVVEFANKYLDVELFQSFTNEFYYAPSKDINNAGSNNITFENYANNKKNNMFKA